MIYLLTYYLLVLAYFEQLVFTLKIFKYKKIWRQEEKQNIYKLDLLYKTKMIRILD